MTGKQGRIVDKRQTSKVGRQFIETIWKDLKLLMTLLLLKSESDEEG